MWKVSHNVDVKETVREKKKQKKLSTYKTRKSDASLDPFRRKRGGGKKSQDVLQKLVVVGKALKGPKCCKSYQRNQTIREGLWKNYAADGSQTTQFQG